MPPHVRMLPIALTLLVLGGCAAGTAAGTAGPPRVRCLESPSSQDPRIEATRPMIFLFCIQDR